MKSLVELVITWLFAGAPLIILVALFVSLWIHKLGDLRQRLREHRLGPFVSPTEQRELVIRQRLAERYHRPPVVKPQTRLVKGWMTPFRRIRPEPNHCGTWNWARGAQISHQLKQDVLHRWK